MKKAIIFIMLALLLVATVSAEVYVKEENGAKVTFYDVKMPGKFFIADNDFIIENGVIAFDSEEYTGIFDKPQFWNSITKTRTWEERIEVNCREETYEINDTVATICDYEFITLEEQYYVIGEITFECESGEYYQTYKHDSFTNSKKKIREEGQPIGQFRLCVDNHITVEIDGFSSYTQEQLDALKAGNNFYYSFNVGNVSSATMIDLSINEVNATCFNMGGTCNTVPGLLLNSTNLDGSTEYLTTNSNVISLDGEYSFATWYNETSISGTVNTIIDIDDSTGGGRFIFRNTASSGIGIYDGAAHHYPGYYPTQGNWVHFAVVCDGTDMLFYINGSLDTNYSSNSCDSDLKDIGYIGGSRPAVGNFVSGELDELAFWDRALTPTEVAQIFNNGEGLNFYTATPLAGNMTFTANNVYDNSTINSFNISIDGSDYITSNGTIITTIPVNDSTVYNYNFTASGYFNQTGSVNASDSLTEQVDSYQAILNLAGSEKYTNNTVVGATFNASIQSGTTLYVNAGDIPVSVEAAGYYNETQNFTTTSLSNTTQVFTDMYTAFVNITAYNYVPSAISIFNTTYTGNATTEQGFASGSEIHYEMIAGNYNITLSASGYPNYLKTFAISTGNNDVNFTYGAFNVTAVDNVSGANVTTFNVTATGSSPSVFGNTSTEWVLLNVVPGTYTLTVLASNYSTYGNFAIASTGGQPTNVTVQLYDSNVVEINLFDQVTGSALAVNATATFIDTFTYEFALVGGTGFATQLEVSTYEVTIEADNYSAATYVVTVGNNSFQVLNAYLVADTSPTVTFTMKDFDTGVVLEDALLSVETPVNGTWTLVNSILSDVTGRIVMDYTADKAYRFTGTKSGYELKLFTLNPVSFASYTVRMSKNATNPNFQDYSNVVIIINPPSYSNNANTTFDILFSAPEGDLSSYFYNITTSFNSTSYAGSGTNAMGASLNNTIVITNATLFDKVYLNYGYVKSDGTAKNYTKVYVIGDGDPASTTMWASRGLHYGLGLFERILIVVGMVLLLSGIAFGIAGINGAGLVAIVLLAYFIKLDFVPASPMVGSMIVIFLLITWRSTY